ncbi:hypothetical protein HDV00_007041 [Rhizophlyctis rosea]|nr:hypothetical protein HDV00_007041 [Rhizophlyctis rosea]
MEQSPPIPFLNAPPLAFPPMATPHHHPPPNLHTLSAPPTLQHLTFPRPPIQQTPLTLGDDIAQRRLASQLRLKTAWDEIFEKYGRDFDDCDEIDMVTGEVVVDRGWLRKTHIKPFASASLMGLDDDGDEGEGEDVEGAEASGDEGVKHSGTGETEEEEEEDEDAFENLLTPKRKGVMQESNRFTQPHLGSTPHNRPSSAFRPRSRSVTPWCPTPTPACRLATLKALSGSKVEIKQTKTTRRTTTTTYSSTEVELREPSSSSPTKPHPSLRLVIPPTTLAELDADPFFDPLTLLLEDPDDAEGLLGLLEEERERGRGGRGVGTGKGKKRKRGAACSDEDENVKRDWKPFMSEPPVRKRAAKGLKGKGGWAKKEPASPSTVVVQGGAATGGLAGDVDAGSAARTATGAGSVAANMQGPVVRVRSQIRCSVEVVVETRWMRGRSLPAGGGVVMREENGHVITESDAGTRKELVREEEVEKEEEAGKGEEAEKEEETEEGGDGERIWEAADGDGDADDGEMVGDGDCEREVISEEQGGTEREKSDASSTRSESNQLEDMSHLWDDDQVDVVPDSEDEALARGDAPLELDDGKFMID